MRHAILLLPVVLALACGYTWVGGSDEGRLGGIAVLTPENESGEAGLDLTVAEALRRAVLRRADAELASDPSRARWVVEGRVLPLEVAAASFSSVLLALEYEVTLSLDLRAVPADGAGAPGEIQLRGSERYLASADVEAQRKNRDEALRRVAGVLASRFLEALAVAGRS